MFDLSVFHINAYIVVRLQVSSVSNCILHSSSYYICQDSVINPPFITTPLEIYSHPSTKPLPYSSTLVWFSTLSLLFLSLPSHHSRNILFLFFPLLLALDARNPWSRYQICGVRVQDFSFPCRQLPFCCVHLGGRGRLGRREAGSRRK